MKKLSEAFPMIRNAIESDASRIAEIHCYGWRNAYKDIISEKFLYSHLSVYRRAQEFIKSKEYKNPYLFVFEKDDLIKGFMKVGPCRNTDKQKSFELWGIYVEPLMQGHGIGSNLLTFCEQIATEKGYTENVIWCLRDNNAARSFYEKHGYSSDGNQVYLKKVDAVEIRYTKQLYPSHK